MSNYDPYVASGYLGMLGLFGECHRFKKMRDAVRPVGTPRRKLIAETRLQAARENLAEAMKKQGFSPEKIRVKLAEFD